MANFMPNDFQLFNPVQSHTSGVAHRSRQQGLNSLGMRNQDFIPPRPGTVNPGLDLGLDQFHNYPLPKLPLGYSQPMYRSLQMYRSPLQNPASGLIRPNNTFINAALGLPKAPLHSNTPSLYSSMNVETGQVCDNALRNISNRVKRSHSESVGMLTLEEQIAADMEMRKRKQLCRSSFSEPTRTNLDTQTKTPLSPYRGVSYHRRDKKWTARTWIKGKMVHLGMFIEEDMAALFVDLRNLKEYGGGSKKKPNFTRDERIRLAKRFSKRMGCPEPVVEYANAFSDAPGFPPLVPDIIKLEQEGLVPLKQELSVTTTLTPDKENLVSPTIGIVPGNIISTSPTEEGPNDAGSALGDEEHKATTILHT
uniref:AP2/ERF domain-containing protein n=1 Tax=Mucochytrium quahogii TaxID=96639 RepID=A0A7S2WIG8_9STRA|mmetsp:Transcript_5234/g.8009  ORF Transcript_5234/g.8009 Transcript_5234/m.8009 type:complete len:365 (-) Transcript_5234:209-1303(-)